MRGKTFKGGNAGIRAGGRILLSYLLWPLLLGISIALNYLGMQTAHSVLSFNASYFLLAGVLCALERLMPHEKQWLQNDGQIIPDLGHTLISKSAVQVLIVLLAVIGLADNVSAEGASWWPRHWPLWGEVVLGLVIAEAGFYAAHRLCHEWPLLWRFHAVHHSVSRLWFVNTGRFHFMDTLVSVTCGLSLGLSVGMPKEIIVWISTITAYIGLLTHCNIEMRFGALNYFFNTPGLHRWHHSMIPQEGNRNYGENLMLFDLLLGTFFNSPRQPPVTIGIHDPMPARFIQQVLHPFRRRIATPIHSVAV